MENPWINTQAFHVPRPIGCQYCCRYRYPNLIVKQATEFVVTNQCFIPSHDWLAPIEVQIGDMKKAMNLVDCRFLLAKTTTIPRMQCPIQKLHTANGSIESYSGDSRKLTSPSLSLREVIE